MKRTNSPQSFLAWLLCVIIMAGLFTSMTGLAAEKLSRRTEDGGPILSGAPRATARPAPVHPAREVKIPFEFVEGLIVCVTPTGRGDLRLIFDTGANATALLGKPKPIEIRIGPKSVRVIPAPLRTSVLEQVNNTLPHARRVDGILGEDVLVQFQSVTVDYKDLEIGFDL